MKWAVAMYSRKIENNHQENFICSCMVEASSKYEAQGKGKTIALKAWKPDKGFTGHDVHVCKEDHILDPEQEIKYEPNSN